MRLGRLGQVLVLVVVLEVLILTVRIKVLVVFDVLVLIVLVRLIILTGIILILTWFRKTHGVHHQRRRRIVWRHWRLEPHRQRQRRYVGNQSVRP